MTVLHCGDPTFAEGFRTKFAVEPISTPVVLDRPAGWLTLPHPDIDFERCIVLSDNRCPSYLMDIVDFSPLALLHLGEPESVASALTGVVQSGAAYPKLETPLTVVERKTLRLTALGMSNKQIAKERGVAERTVKNSLASVYKKLGFNSRVQAAHYYLGNWHLLLNWSPPKSVKVL